MTRYIAIVSGKGGVGKTTTALNLGFALNAVGRNVTLVDCFSSSLKDYLGMRIKNSLADVLAGKREMREATYIHPSGLKVVPSHNIPLDNKRHLSDALLDIYGKSEIVLLDGITGYGKDAKELLDVADEALFVCGPDEHSAQSLIPLVNAAEHHGAVVLGAIVNNHSNSVVKSLQLLRPLGIPVVATVPFDRNIHHAYKSHLPVIIPYPGSKSSVEYFRLASLFWKNG